MGESCWTFRGNGLFVQAKAKAAPGTPATLQLSLPAARRRSSSRPAWPA